MEKLNIENNALIILIAGSSTRFGGEVKKQFILVDDKPIFMHTINNLVNLGFKRIIIVSKNDDMSRVQNYIKNDYYDNSINFEFVNGGYERFYSVFNAMKYLKENSSPHFVFIHDGVRPLVMADEIENLKKSVYENNASILATKVIDTIKKVDDKKAIKLTIDRDYLYRAVTPQAFNFELYYKAMSKYIYSFENDNNETIATDDAQIYSDYIGEVFVVDSSIKNIKITQKSDLDLFLRLR